MFMGWNERGSAAFAAVSEMPARDVARSARRVRSWAAAHPAPARAAAAAAKRPREQADGGAFHIALDARDLSREAQPRLAP